MCTTCGCDSGSETHIHSAGDHNDAHGHDHHHAHPHSTLHHSHDRPSGGNVVTLEQDILAWNDHLAAHNRSDFSGADIFAVNMLSSPGSGKTTLLARTIADIGNDISCSVVEGDQATQNDARRIREAGARAVQVNTGTGCHLEADMLARAQRELAPPPGSVLFIENVGNLVCPALFDLGEHKRVVLLSVTEGDDKPEKYPHIFRSADLVLFTKIDLHPHVSFDIERCTALIKAENSDVETLSLSATTGNGLNDWYEWLRRHRQQPAGVLSA